MEKVNPHLGKTGVYMQKVETSEYVFKATENHTEQLIDMINNKIVPNTKISEEALSEIKKFFQSHFVALTSKLLKADQFENKQPAVSDESKKIISYTPDEQNIAIARSYDITVHKDTDAYSQDNNFNLMLNFHLENLFVVPIFLSFLAIRDRQKATEITIKEIRELQSEINELLKFKKYFVNETDPRKIVMMEILKARNELIDKNKKIPLMQDIASFVRPDKHKNTLNSELKALGIKFDYKTGIFSDRKTNEVIEIK